MKCLNDGKELTGKKKYCNDRCRMAYVRRTKKGALPEHLQPEHEQNSTRTFDFKLTRTDRQFERKYPGYHNFGTKVHERQCFMCDKEFKTRLQLLKVCSIKCKENMMDSLTTMGKS